MAENAKNWAITKTYHTAFEVFVIVSDCGAGVVVVIAKGFGFRSRESSVALLSRVGSDFKLVE